MVYQLADGRRVSKVEFYSSCNGEAFGQMIQAGYGVDMNVSSDPLVWRPRARGFETVTLDDILAPPLGVSPKPWGAAPPRSSDLPGFVSSRFTKGDQAAGRTRRERREVEFRAIAGQFVDKGHPRMKDLASLSSLGASIRAELEHRSARAATYTNSLRAIWAVPVVEAEYRHQQSGSLPDEAQSARTGWELAWDEVRRGRRVEGILKRVDHWITASPFLPPDISERQGVALRHYLYEREPELELAETLAVRLSVCDRILRAAAYGWRVDSLWEKAEPPFEVLLGFELFNERMKQRDFSIPVFKNITELSKWVEDAMPTLGMDADSIRKKLSFLYAPEKKGPRPASDVAAIVDQLLAAQADWERRFE